MNAKAIYGWSLFFFSLIGIAAYVIHVALPSYSYSVFYDASYRESVQCRTNVRTGKLEINNHGKWVNGDDYQSIHGSWHLDADIRRLGNNP